MIKELVKDEAILSQPCDAATAKDAQVAQDLLDTLASLDNAACLAANQIGVSKCIVAYLDEKRPASCHVNPTLKLALGAFKAEEGLPFPRSRLQGDALRQDQGRLRGACGGLNCNRASKISPTGRRRSFST